MSRREMGESARREQRTKRQGRAEKFTGETKDRKAFTQAQFEDFESEVKIALHESSHIMAAWMLGQPIDGMRFNDREGASRAAENTMQRSVAEPATRIRVQEYPDQVPHFYAEVVIGHPLPEMQSRPIGERLVQAKEQAFISLAGVFGCSNEAWSDNPLSEFETKAHLSEAIAKFVLIAGVSLSDAGKECAPLVPHVKQTFDDERVQAVTHALAKQFLKRRTLTGEEATAIIEQSWIHAEEDMGHRRISV